MQKQSGKIGVVRGSARFGHLPLWRYAMAPLMVLATAGQAKTASEVFDIAAKSTVVVLAYDERGGVAALGSGVALPDGSIATNCHVIRQAARVAVRYEKHEYQANVRYTDWDRDLCTLDGADLGSTPVTLGDTRLIKIGARVYAVGAPQGLELTLSEGIVSALRPVADGRYIQTTAPISRGSSGGGLFDDEGRLLGLTSFYVEGGQNLNFALPVEWIAALPQRHGPNRAATTTWLDWFNKAAALQDRDHWPAAVQHALLWTEAMPEEPFAWFFAGLSYLMSDQTAKAIEAFQQALRIDPQYATAWNNLGIAYSRSGEITEAIESYQQALRIDSEDGKTWSNLGAAYHAVSQTAKAIDAYRQALRIDSRDTKAWLNLGLAYGQTGQTANEIGAYQQALRIDSHYAKAWYSLGYAYGQSGQTANEIEAYQQALRIDSHYAKAWYALGYTYKINGQQGKVAEVYQHLKVLDQQMADEFFREVVLP